MKPIIHSKKQFKFTKSKPKRIFPVNLILETISFCSLNLPELLNLGQLNKEINLKIKSNIRLLISKISAQILTSIKLKIDPLIISNTLTSQKLFSHIRNNLIEKLNQRLKFLNKIFCVNSSKENKINAIIEKLEVNLQVFFEGKKIKPIKSFRKLDNCSSFMFDIFEIEALIKNKEFSFQAKISSKYGEFNFMEFKKLSLQELIKNSNSLKVYSYKIIKNALFVQFKNDTTFSWMFLHLSFMEIIGKIRDDIEMRNKRLKGTKEINEIISVGTFIAENLDYEMVFSLYNNKERVFYHINSRLVPFMNLNKISKYESELKRIF